MGQQPNKYHISDDGKVFRINDDGSFTSLGNIEKIEKKLSSPSRNVPASEPGAEITKKRSLHPVLIADCIVIFIVVAFFVGWDVYAYLDKGSALDESSAEGLKEPIVEINGMIVNWGEGVNAEQRRVLSQLISNMVFVSGGTFTMGASPIDSEAYDWEKPAHQVTLSSYRIGRYEVTQKEWITVMGNNPSYFIHNDLPVQNVSWNDCQEFIQRLNCMTGLRFHLPTEAQWEYAARGGNRSNGYKYSGSNNIGSVAWYNDNSGGHVHPVGQKSPNELGLYDMSGNVWEWCQDWYDGSYYSQSPTINTTGSSTGSDRVRRGGCWNYIPRVCRSTYRGIFSPSDRFNSLGFRLVL